MAAIGGERTYRIDGGTIGGQASYMVFIEQQATRAVLQALAMGGGAIGLAAGLMLKKMPPEPTPESTSVYIKETAEISAAVSLGGAGISATVSQEVEARATLNRSGTVDVELKYGLSGDESGSMFGKEAGQGASASGSFKLTIGTDGLPSAVEFTAELDHRISSTTTAERGTVTAHTLSAHIDILPSDRTEIAALAKRIQSGDTGAAGQLIHKLQAMAQGAKMTSGDSSYDYVKTEKQVGGGPVELSASDEVRTNFTSSESSSQKEVAPS